jgi:Zn-dependent protease
MLLVVTYVHEMGHIAAGRRLGVSAERITLHALGGLAHLDSGAPHPKGEMLIALAGPATHVPLWIVFFGAARGVESLIGPTALSVSMLDGFASLQVSLCIFNLLPFYPLDGGRVTRALLSMRMHPNRASLITASLGFAGAVLFGLVGLGFVFGKVQYLFAGEWGGVMLLIAVENYQSCRRLQMEARWSEGPYAQVEEWKRGVVDPIEQAMKESRRITDESRAPRRQSRASAAAVPRAPKEPTRDALQKRVDELLDKINEVGMGGLTGPERKELEEASRRLKG